jgi:putative heme-binding domain-containing protein
VDPEVKQRVVSALGKSDDEKIAPALLKLVDRQTPALRRAILDVLLANGRRARGLVEALEAGQIAATELDLARRARLLQSTDAELRARVERLFAVGEADRRRVIEDYEPVLAMTGDAERGREVFKNRCSSCHRTAGIGVDVAPDISDSREKKPEQILSDILDPNRAIDNNYVAFSVALADGQVHSGIIAAETPTSITLKQPDGKSLTILRSEIETLRSTGKSLMPEGLEKEITQQQMSDLIGFIKNWRYLDEGRGTKAND